MTVHLKQPLLRKCNCLFLTMFSLKWEETKTVARFSTRWLIFVCHSRGVGYIVIPNRLRSTYEVHGSVLVGICSRKPYCTPRVLWDLIFRKSTEFEATKVVGTCFALAHRTTASFNAVLLGKQWLEYASTWPVNMTKTCENQRIGPY